MKATITAAVEACGPQPHVRGRAHRRTLRGALALLVALLFALGFALPEADAQGKRRKRRKRRKRPRPAKVEPAPEPAPAPDDPPEAPPVVTADDGDDGSGAATSRGDDDAGVRANTRETKGAQVFDFTGLELGGQLRMPQLLYFLDRANEELQRASLEKRSFIPEMSRSLDEESL